MNHCTGKRFYSFNLHSFFTLRVIRLCTDDEKVVSYWNNIDSQLELDMDQFASFSVLKIIAYNLFLYPLTSVVF